MAYLVLVRHGESEWNALSLWTGWTDVNLTEKGREEAKKAGGLIQDIHFDYAFTSDLKRAKQTLDEILMVINQKDIPVTEDRALKERNYGDLTGKNKWKIKEEYGDEQFMKWRRSWDYPVPNGEALKDVYNRVVPYYNEHILPLLKQEKNVLIAAHGNSLRALIKELEHISDADIPYLELGTGSVYVYKVDGEGKILNKDIRITQESK
jgi:2,3-bisphosphoglycerate-dependent phosphoglycerate mutase